MKKSNLFLLGLGYLAGLAVAVRFGKDGKGKDMDAIVADLKAVHKNLFSEAEEVIFSEENKAKITEFQKSVEAEIQAFQIEARAKMTELKDKGVEKKSEIEKELKDVYARREGIIADLKAKSLLKLDETKGSGEVVLKQLQEKIEQLSRSFINELEEVYQDLKKKLK